MVFNELLSGDEEKLNDAFYRNLAFGTAGLRGVTLVAEGKMRDVRTLLGRYYQIRGEVQHGRQRGGQVLGFPTANLRILEDDLCPRRGVYVTQVIYDGRRYGGISNIGRNSTFGERCVS